MKKMSEAELMEWARGLMVRGWTPKSGEGIPRDLLRAEAVVKMHAELTKLRKLVSDQKPETWDSILAENGGIAGMRPFGG